MIIIVRPHKIDLATRHIYAPLKRPKKRVWTLCPEFETAVPKLVTVMYLKCVFITTVSHGPNFGHIIKWN